MGRNEDILRSILGGEVYVQLPQSRMEALLIEIGKMIDQGGADPEAVKAAVQEYLAQHPVQTYDDTEVRGDIAEIKGDYAQQIELLKAVRDALNGGDVPAAIGLLDAFLLDKNSIA